MEKLESELDNLAKEEFELIKHTEIEEKKNNIEFLKSRLAKLRRGLQNKQSARNRSQHGSSPIRGYITRPKLHAAFKKRSRTRDAVFTRGFVRRRRYRKISENVGIRESN